MSNRKFGSLSHHYMTRAWKQSCAMRDWKMDHAVQREVLRRVDRVSGKQACQHDQTALSSQASCRRQQADKAARAVVLIDLPNRHSIILKPASVVTIRLTLQSLRLQIADILPLRSHYSKMKRWIPSLITYCILKHSFVASLQLYSASSWLIGTIAIIGGGNFIDLVTWVAEMHLGTCMQLWIRHTMQCDYLGMCKLLSYI
jgi:hypothetical protein